MVQELELKGSGLRKKFIISIIIFIALLALAISFVLYNVTYNKLESELRAKGKVLTSKVAIQAAPHLYLIGAASSKIELVKIIQEILGEDFIEYAIIYNSIGQIVQAGEIDKDKIAVSETADNLRKINKVLLKDKKFDEIYFRAIDVKLIEQSESKGSGIYNIYCIIKYAPQLTAPGETSSFGDNFLEPYGLVQLGINTRIVSQRVQEIIRPTIITLIIILIVGGVIGGYTVNKMIAPLKRLARIAKAISQGDLSKEVTITRNDEIGVVEKAFQDMNTRLRDMIGMVREAAQNLGDTSEHILSLTKEVTEGSVRQSTSTEKSTELIQRMIGGIREIYQSVERLTKAAENNSSSIMQMAGSTQEVAYHTESLSASVDETSSSIEEMTASITQVAENVHALSSSMQVTASSINEIDVSIKQVEENAKESSRVSEQVAKDAETGMGTVESTIEGMNRIKHAVEETEAVILSLGGSSQKIGEILDVINDIARQTNLLALNAAIIAAQAGEHGRGFAVVSDEIRDLSERTAASTQEIAELIKGVQKEVQRAVTAMEAGSELTVEGVKLANDSGQALKQILASAKNSTALTKAIAKTTMEQSRGSKHVTEAIDNIWVMVQQIDNATQEQAKGSKLIMKATENMKDNTEQVRKATEEQFNGSKLITKSTEEVKEMTQKIEASLKVQDEGSHLIMDAIEEILSIVRQNQRAAREMDVGVQKLIDQGKELEAAVQKFML